MFAGRAKSTKVDIYIGSSYFVLFDIVCNHKPTRGLRSRTSRNRLIQRWQIILASSDIPCNGGGQHSRRFIVLVDISLSSFKEIDRRLISQNKNEFSFLVSLSGVSFSYDFSTS